MRDKDKPFVMVRRGPWNFTIMPRGRGGWTQFAAWLAVYLVPTIAFAIYAERFDGTPQIWIALALFLAGTMVWSIASLRWMKARAEVVDLNELLKLKREAERKVRRPK